MAKIWSKLIAFEKVHQLLRPTDKILAAVSGGPDSVCLAHYLANLRRRRGFSLHLLHVHHGLRGRQASLDADFVQKLGTKLGVPVTIVAAAVARQAKIRKKGLEDAGRELRYLALKKTALRFGCNKAATGHQLDDQAETVLLHLLRGTRLKALGAIAPERPLTARITLIRPLMPLKRTEVMEYLKVFNLKYRLDRSNLSLYFTRNWLRHEIIPELEKRHPHIREHLSGIAAQVRRLGDRLGSLVDYSHGFKKY